MNHTDIEEREQDAINDLADAKERIGQLEEDLERGRATNERLIQKLETEVKNVAVLEDDLSFWKKECTSAINHIEQLEEDVGFWKGEYEAGVGRVQIVERDLANAQRDLAEISKLRSALGQWCDSDSEIEKQCAEILGHDYVKGDSYSVPGTLACVEEVVKRFKQSKTDLAEITQLAVDYKEANMRLEEELREFHDKDGGRTREHNLLVQENRRLREALNAIAHHPGADSDRNELDSGEWRDALVQIAREALKPTK